MRATPAATSVRLVDLRDDASDDDRRVDAGLAEEPNGLGDETPVRPGEHREPDEIHVLVARGCCDLLGGEPDALIDDLHARVARGHCDLFRTVRMAVEPGLSHQDADGVPDLARSGLDVLAHLLHTASHGSMHAAHTGRRAVLAEHLAQGAGPLANRAARARQRDRRGHEVLGGQGRGAERVERMRDRVAVATRTPTLEAVELFLLRLLVHHENAGPFVECGHERGIGRFGEAIDPDRPGCRRLRSCARARRGSARAVASSSRSWRRLRHRRAPTRARPPQPPPAPKSSSPPHGNPRTGRRTRGDRSRTPAPAGPGVTTAGPRAAGARVPRSTRAAGSPAPERRVKATPRGSRARCAARCSRAAPR